MAIQCLVLSQGVLKTLNAKNRWENVGSESELSSDLITVNGFLYSDLTASKTKIYLDYTQTDTFDDGTILYESEQITSAMNAQALADYTNEEGEELLEVTVPAFTIKDGITSNDYLLAYSEDENFVPQFINVEFGSRTTHNQAVSLTFDVLYNYNTKLKFRIRMNDGEYGNWSSLVDPYKQIVTSIPFSNLIAGANKVEIQVANDEETKTATKVIENAITVENGTPTVAIMNDSSDSFKVHFQIVDPDLDQIRYRILITNSKYKGKVLRDWSEFISSGESVKYYIDTVDVVANEINALKIEFEDKYGAKGTTTYSFKGEYSNLVFLDEDGNYYSDDKGNTLKLLDYLTILAGAVTDPKEITLKNNNSLPITNLIINSVKLTQATGVEVQLSKINNPFIPLTKLEYGDEVLEVGESKKFYVRIDSTIDAYELCKFNIEANASIHQ